MIFSTPGSFLEEVSGEEQLPRLFLVHNLALERLMFDRNLMGVDFRRTCLEASSLFLGHILDEYDPEESAELLILSKGLVYQLPEAVAARTGKNLPTNLIATSRTSVTAHHAEVEVAYARFESPSSTLIVGDTVASGTTIITAVDRYRREHSLSRLYVLSYAGTLVGASKVAGYCRQRGIDATFLFGLAAFGLADNGFDLSFLHPATITREEYRRRAAEQFDGRPVSAVGWDFGSQAMAPRKYRELCWVEAELWKLQGFPCFKSAERPRDLSALQHEARAYSQLADGIQDDM